jgi:uncharacterized membrane protein
LPNCQLFCFKEGELIKKGVKLLFLLLVPFLLIGCSAGNIGLVTTDLDDLEIQAIADSIKTAIEIIPILMEELMRTYILWLKI